MSRRPGRPSVLDRFAGYFSTVDVRIAAGTGGAASLITAALIALLARDLGGVAWAFLGLGAILIIVAAAAGYRSIRSAVMTRQGFYGFNTTAMILLFLAIASIVILGDELAGVVEELEEGIVGSLRSMVTWPPSTSREKKSRDWPDVLEQPVRGKSPSRGSLQMS